MLFLASNVDMYVHNLLSMKSFHGALAGKVHECLLTLSIGRVRSITPAVIEERLRTAFPRHRAAIVEFGFYLSANERENFEKAWRAYYEVGGSVSFLYYSTDEENGYQVFQ